MIYDESDLKLLKIIKDTPGISVSHLLSVFFNGRVSFEAQIMLAERLKRYHERGMVLRKQLKDDYLHTITNLGTEGITAYEDERNLAKIFVSYSREDSTITIKLYNDLTNLRKYLWIDQIDILPGKRWDTEIAHSMNECEAFIIILSKYSTTSQNVLDEINFALTNSKIIIPIKLDDCIIPYRLQRFQFINFELKYEQGLENLLKAFDTYFPPKKKGRLLNL